MLKIADIIPFKRPPAKKNSNWVCLPISAFSLQDTRCSFSVWSSSNSIRICLTNIFYTKAWNSINNSKAYTIINNSKASTSINNSKACRILIKSLLSPYHLNSRDIQCSKVLSTDKISRHLHQHFHQSMTETDPNGIKLQCKYCPSGSLGEYSYKSSSHLKSHIIPQRCSGPGQVAWSEGDNRITKFCCCDMSTFVKHSLASCLISEI